MFKKLSIIVIIFTFASFFYGILHLYVEVESNGCRMTYMFDKPQFTRIEFKENAQFPHYGLYYYYEGRKSNDMKDLTWKGAPVLFVPGNGGSYKQVRSLASVALRKSIDDDNHKQLDYFTIDFKEDLSALYGGYLLNQKNFLKLCIKAIRNFYKEFANVDKSVVLIGHSMGGKVAQSILDVQDYPKYINSIISISSPLNHPVIYTDTKINELYMQTEKFLSSERVAHVANRDTNYCYKFKEKVAKSSWNTSTIVKNVLLISMGGGNRDLLVRDDLTISKYSDIHAMTSAVPKVWLSCDHLSAVWCLQLMLVINRFLFAIVTVDRKRNMFFLEDKPERIQAAVNQFVKPYNHFKAIQVDFGRKYFAESIWYESSKIVYWKNFPNGLKRFFHYILAIRNFENYKKIYAEVSGYSKQDWIFACSELVVHDNKSMCERGLPIFQHIQILPSIDITRSMALIDIEYLSKYYPNWTHIYLRLPPTSKPINFKIDIYKAKERKLYIRAPHWISFDRKILINETLHGTTHYEILIQGLEDIAPTLIVFIEPVACIDQNFNIVAKLCVPWARGFERYKLLSDSSIDMSIYVNAPFPAPNRYNTTDNPIRLEIFLDPKCRYRLSYQSSIAHATSRIVLQFYHWLPAHFIAVLFMVLRNQINKLDTAPGFLFSKPYVGYFQYTSLYVAAGCRLLKKLLLPLKFLPAVDANNHSFYITIIIHSTAIVVSMISVLAIWIVLVAYGNTLFNMAQKLGRITAPTSSILLQITSTLPISFGVLFISIACASCSGIALALATIFYFIMLSNAYKDHIQNWLWTKVMYILRIVYSKVRGLYNPQSNQVAVTPTTPNILQSTDDLCDYQEGLDNISFHSTMLLLMMMMTSLCSGLTLAWVKSKYGGHFKEHLPDPSLKPTVIVLLCLSVLLQLRAPHRTCNYNFVVTPILYICSCACILYGQEHLYRLNYIIMSGFVAITLQELYHWISSKFFSV